MQLLGMLPVVELFLDLAAYPEVQIGRHLHIDGVEQTVNVARNFKNDGNKSRG